MPLRYADVARAIEAEGLAPRGGFRPAPEDAVPPLPDGRAAAAVVLAGDVGERMWPVFEAARARYTGEDPLDAWTREVLGRVAAATGGHALFPFDGPPYHPFQRWARRAEPVHPSPVGILIHPDWGLWHAYRGALAFAEALDVPACGERPSPCATCADRPCLDTCPVAAFTDRGYDVDACVGHVASSAGGSCATNGCLARRACPVGTHRHGPAQAAFHMAAFVHARKAAAQAARVSSGASPMKR
ncbi:MAG: hypothetical protein WD673_08345 [Alphaproteobacteria bacterium]